MCGSRKIEEKFPIIEIDETGNYIHIYMHVYIYEYIYRNMYLYIYIHVYIYIYVCVYIYTYIYRERDYIERSIYLSIGMYNIASEPECRAKGGVRFSQVHLSIHISC